MFLRHGQAHRRIYVTWADMKQRCANPKCRNYRFYGARGITVCNEWLDFLPFYEWATTHGYADNLTIDRIDSKKGYSPNNCQWLPVSENVRRSAATTEITAFGETKYVQAWTRDPRCVVNAVTFSSRLSRGWNAEEALTQPTFNGGRRAMVVRKDCIVVEAFGERKTIYQWANDSRCSVAAQSIKTRLRRGWHPEEAVARSNVKCAGKRID